MIKFYIHTSFGDYYQNTMLQDSYGPTLFERNKKEVKVQLYLILIQETRINLLQYNTIGTRAKSMCIIRYQNKIYAFNVLSEAMEFMLGIDKIKIQYLELINSQNLIGRNDKHQREQGQGKDLRKLEFDCQKISSGKTRKGLYVLPGINVCGICTNPNCELLFKLVYWHLEDEQAWNIPRITQSSKCPACKQSIGKNIKNIAYYHCQWLVIGKIKGHKNSFKLNEKTNPDECKQYLPKKEEPTVEFEYLSIQAKPLK